MSNAALFWIITFTLAAGLFFVTAAVITVLGVRDLRELLSGPTQRTESKRSSEQE